MSAAPAPRPSRPSGPAPGRPPLRAVPRPKRPRPAAPRPGGPATTPLGIRLALVPVRLALVPVRLAITLLARLTGGRPWLVLILALGCGVIALHAATLQTNQRLSAGDTEISKLERGNATLRNDVAELSAADRVSEFGRSAGMVIADPEGVGYLDSRTTSAARAASMIAPPSADWKPAPNPSEQNGDAPTDAEGTAPGTGDASAPAAAATPATGAAAAPAATATPSASTGTAATGRTTTGTGTTSGGTGTTTGTAATATGGAATTGTTGTSAGTTGTATAGGGTSYGTTSTGTTAGTTGTAPQGTTGGTSGGGITP